MSGLGEILNCFRRNKNLAGIKSLPGILSQNINDSLQERNLDGYNPSFIDNLHSVQIIKDFISCLEKEWGPTSQETVQFRKLCNEALHRGDLEACSIWTAAPNREWRKLIGFLAVEGEKDSRFQNTKFYKDHEAVYLCKIIAELFSILYSSDLNISKEKRILNLLSLITKGYVIGTIFVRRFKKMNVYLHDMMTHTSMQYALYGSFRATSCEQDEALFSTMKDIIKNFSNHHDELLRTILLRLASAHSQHLEYGYQKQLFSPIGKIYESYTPKNLQINLIDLQEKDSLFEYLSRFQFGEEWYQVNEKGIEFYTENLPENFGQLQTFFLEIKFNLLLKKKKKNRYTKF